MPVDPVGEEATEAEEAADSGTNRPGSNHADARIEAAERCGRCAPSGERRRHPATHTDTRTQQNTPDPKAEGVCAEPLRPVVVCRVVFDAVGAQRSYPGRVP